ncbi:transcription termination/antitermination NusG family protein [Cobetia sp. ICG0124]|uniref:transcription termination/antitermination NusG family protein n=1 Tax=Cobetia sp. ICG0124 TaxID=2053669 RepID=UPI0032047F27
MSEVRDAAKAHWYLIQCKGGESFRAAENLTNQGFHVFHPLLEVERKRGSKLRWVEEPLLHVHPAGSGGRQLAPDSLDTWRAQAGQLRHDADTGPHLAGGGADRQW